MASNPFFSHLDSTMVAELAKRSEMRDFAPGVDLLREGESGDAAYVVRAGTVTVSMLVQDNAVEVAERGAGALMGEISLLCEVPHTATVTAKTDVLALRISLRLASSATIVGSRWEKNGLDAMLSKTPPSSSLRAFSGLRALSGM